MAISDQLTLLNNTKTAIRTAINNKGGSVGASDTFASYATAIDNLPSGGSGNPLLKTIDVDDFTGTTFNQATSYVTDVTIPSGVTSIAAYAFNGFSSLTSVVIPNTVTNIGNNIFYNSGITNINLGNSITSIPKSAFESCTKLTSIEIPSSVTTIGQSAFRNCTAMTNVVLPNTLTSIDLDAFRLCRKLTSINIPDSVQTIGSWTFANCDFLASAKIGNGITKIDARLFDSCSRLTSIVIPSSVTSIEVYAFNGCSSLTSITVNATTPPTLANANAFNSTNNCPIYVPSESVDAYKTASNWSTYASRIYPIAQVATVDGNPVYNYEIGNKDSKTIMSTEMDKLPTGTSIEFAEGLTNIAAGEINYQQVTLPSTFTGFGDSNMIGSSVSTITSNAVTPPSAFKNRIGGSGLTAIYVPAASVDTYKENATWSSFASIIQAIQTE